MLKKRIITIGNNTLDDFTTLCIIGDWFAEHRNDPSVIRRIMKRDHDDYDMATLPEKGDGIDAIKENTEMVIALHLYGIRGEECVFANAPSMYNRNNEDLLEICMKRNIPLVAWGGQPWLGIERKTQIHSNNIWLYEPYIKRNSKKTRKPRV